MMLYVRLLNIEVKKIAKRHHWSIWFCYNDKRKNFRRLSYCRNGCKVSDRTKQSIRKDVMLLLEKHGILAEVYWRKSCHNFPSTYGDYDKLCIKIPKD